MRDRPTRRVLLLDGSRATLGDPRTLATVSPLFRELAGHWAVPAAPCCAEDMPVQRPRNAFRAG